MAKLKPDVIEWILKLNSTQAQEEYHKLEKANRELKKENDATRKSMVELEKQGKKGSQEWKNLKSAIESNNRTMADNRKKMEAISKQFDQSTMTVNQLRKQLKELTREFNNTSKATDPKRYKELQQQIQKTKEALSQATGSTTAFGGALSKLTKMGEIVKGFFFTIGAAILTNFVGAFRNAFSIVVDFERENSKLASILGTTREGITDMTKAARQLGATTSYSAAEVTQLQIELAKLGFQKDQILAMEGSVLKFAKAVGTDLASASAFTGAALRIFGKDASEAETVLASFAVATTKTALDFSKLETALSTVGPVAAAAGFSLEDTTALLGQLANAGFDASSAATATRNIILKMVDPAGDLTKALGGPVKTADELAAGFQRLQAAGIDLATALELSDKRSVAAFQTFIEQSGKLIELRDSITGVNDQFNAMAETMSDNVAGALAGLKSASEELILQISDGSRGPLKNLIEILTAGVRKLQEFAKWVQENYWRIKPVIAGIVSWKVAQLALNGVQKLWNGLVALSNSLMNTFNTASQRATQAQRLYAAALEEGKTKMQAFGVAMKGIPWMSVISALVSIIALVKSYSTVMKSSTAATSKMADAEREAAERAKEHARKREELNVSIESEKRKLLDLHAVASDVNAAESERLKAINALNAAIPGYNGYIDKTTGKLIANTAALKENIVQMERRMRLAYYKDEYQAYLQEEEKAKMRRIKAQNTYNNFVQENSSNGIFLKPTEEPTQYTPFEIFFLGKPKTQQTRFGKELDALKSELNFAKEQERQTQDNTDAFIIDMARAGHSFEEVVTAGVETDIPVDGSKVTLPSGGSKGKGKGKGKSSNGSSEQRKDKIKEATAAADALHQANLADLEGIRDSLTETQYVIDKNRELIRYCEDLTQALDKLKGETKETGTDLLNKIAERQGKIDQEAAKAQQAINAAIHAQEEKFHADFLASQEAFYQDQQRQMEKAVQKGEITRDAADIYLLTQEKAMHETQLKRLRDYYDQVAEADYLGNQAKKERLEELRKDIKEMQSKILTDTGVYTERLRELMENPTGFEALKRNYEAERLNLQQTYAEMLKTVKAGSDEEARLKSELTRRLLVLDYQYQDQLYGLQEKVGLSWADEYDLELLRLKQMHAEGLISEKDYQKKRFELGVNHAKQYFDYYSGLSSSMFQAIQDAEIAMSDAKYDVLIRQAENNGEETAQLEQEKENKKLEIQKKYADVNFAIKVSQIVADTAVAIMKAFADLGPIGGAVAAAMLTATGVAQVISANAEREKIKKLQPKSVSTSSVSASSATATRVLSGYSEGGYTGDGNRYEVAGLVHKGEYVVPKPIMSNPRVVDAVGTIEAIRLQRQGKPKEFAEGGFTGSSGSNRKVNMSAMEVTSSLISELHSVCKEMKTALKNVKAYVVLQDLEKKQKQLNDARAPFTR